MTKIIKGLPISFVINLNESNTAVNLNDGTWTTNVDLRYQSTDGPSPFDVSGSASGNSVFVELSGDQTSTLDHRGTGYVFIIKASKNDGTVNLRSVVPVGVVNDI